MLSCVLALQANAQITVTDMDENPGLTAQNLANALAGPGVSIVANSAQLVQTADPFGSPVEPPLSAAGTFTVANSVLGTGFSGGVILSTGRADNVEGTEDALSIEGNYNALPDILAQLGLLGDADLELLYGGETDFFDATSLEFDFEPDADYVSIQFIFASEEYTEFVEDGFNDTFAIFVNGQTVNLATVEPHDDPVSVDTINLEQNRLLYRNNDIHNSPVALDGFYVTEADGFTTVITCILPVDANEENSLKIVISDAGDDVLDSWALLKGASLTTVKPLIVTKEAENPEALVENEYMNYFIHLTNTGSSAATVYEIHDLLPAGFQYQTMSTTGFTTDEPVISYISDGSDIHELLVWEGPYTVPANTTVTLSFPAHVGYELGTFYNGATAIANVPVIPSGDTAPVVVKEAVDIEVRDPANNKLVDGSAFIDFGGWISGSSQIPRTFTIRNDGLTTNLTGISVTATGANSADFIVDTTGMSTSLAPGASTTFTVRFKPSATGGRYANLEIESDDPDEDPFDVYLYGYGSTALAMAQEAYAKASIADANRFGESTAVWGDTVVIGAPWDSKNGATPPGSCLYSGAAYVFRRNPANGTWAQEAYLKASDVSMYSWFGCSVSIHENTIAVGAIGNESVYVFTRSGSTWSEQEILQAPFSELGDQFGFSVDVYGDTLAVGTPGDDSGYAGDEEDTSEPEAGAIHVFVRSGATWSRQAYLKSNTPYTWDLFGHDVAIHGDTVVASAIGWSGWTGYVEVHTRSSTTWSRQAVIAPTHLDSEDSFGESVDVWGDSIIIGAAGDDSYSTTGSTIYTDNDGTTVNWGAAYVYKRTGSTWAHQAFLKPSTYPIDQVWFGSDVSIAGDVAVVGAWGDWSDDTGIGASKDWLGAQSSGAAYVFTRSGTSWSEKAFVKASNTGAGDRFSRVGVHGETVVVGAGSEDSNATGINGNQGNNSTSEAGAAYFFELFD